MTDAPPRPLPPGWAAASALCSAALLVLAYPSFGIEPLAWVALVPLLVALRGRGPAMTAPLSLLFGALFAALCCAWYTEADGFGPPELAAFSLFIGLSFTLFGLLFGLVSRARPGLSLAAAPAIWVSMEYLRLNAGALAYPGLFLAHTQHRALPVIQISAFTGAYGVSFLIVVVNALLAETAHRLGFRRSPSGASRPALPLRGAALTAGLMAVSLGYGVGVMAGAVGGSGAVVTVVQGNIPQDVRWDERMRERHLEKHVALTREAARSARADLVVWAETTVQGSLRHDPVLNETMGGLARDIGSPLLVGSAERAKFRPRDRGYPNRYNSAFLISPAGEIAGEYRKIRLFPFGEYLPYQGVFPWPLRYLRTSNYLAGKERTLFDLPGARFAALICWESMFPGLVREFVDRGADFVVDISNEAWFGESAAPRFFHAINVFRAVENRVSLVRVSNAGISCFIDPWGRILGLVERDGRDVNVEGTLTRTVPLSPGRTWYSRHGDLFSLACLLFTGILVARSVRAPVSGDPGVEDQP